MSGSASRNATVDLRCMVARRLDRLCPVLVAWALGSTASTIENLFSLPLPARGERRGVRGTSHSDVGVCDCPSRSPHARRGHGEDNGCAYVRMKPSTSFSAQERTCSIDSL